MELSHDCDKNLATVGAPTEADFDVDDLIEYCPEPVAESTAKASADKPNESAVQCSKCDLCFESPPDQRRHFAVVHQGWPLVREATSEQAIQLVYVCSLCSRQYELMEDLRGHMIEFHKYEPADEGDSAKVDGTAAPEQVATVQGKNLIEPGVAAPQTAEYQIEAMLEMRPLPFKDFRILLRSKMLLRCPASPSCVYKFETAAKAAKHAACHAGDTAREFKCSACGLVAENWRRCSTHLWKVHQLDVDLLHCPLCGFRAHASVLVWRHMRFHKKWRPRVLKSLRAVRDKRQREAKRQKDETVEKTKPAANKNKYYSEKTCEICNRKFVNGKTLSKHVKSVHNKIKPFICNVCGKKMARKASLIIHMRQHTGEKPLKCTTCKFATRDPSVLKKHQMRHEKAGKHNCSICDYVCIQTNAFKRHMRLNHPEEFKKISCDLCSFVTINEQRLHAHKEDHRKGLIVHVEDSQDAAGAGSFKNPSKQLEKHVTNADISADYFLPLESVDSLPHEPTVDTGGVTIPAPSEDTQFPTYLNN